MVAYLAGAGFLVQQKTRRGRRFRGPDPEASATSAADPGVIRKCRHYEDCRVQGFEFRVIRGVGVAPLACNRSMPRNAEAFEVGA